MIKTESHRPRPSRRRRNVLLSGTALTAASLLAMTGGSAVAQISGGSTVHVIEHAVTDTVVHSGGTGHDHTGDTLTFHNQVFDSKDKRRVGHDQGFCVRISPTEGTYECMWTTFLAHGQLTVEGPFYDKKNSVLAITGGTGAYRSARGEMTLLSRNAGKEYDFIFHIS